MIASAARDGFARRPLLGHNPAMPAASPRSAPRASASLEDEPGQSYRALGYAHLREFIPIEVAKGLLARLKLDLAAQGVGMERLMREQPLLRQPAAELYGYHYPPLATFHWGMTPAIERLVGETILPTYAYFRLYRAGDICRVHSDRPACEHSLSLTLDYADGIVWPLEVAPGRIDKPYARVDDAFGPEERAQALAMAAGDAVLYQGVHHHHGRTQPNPNQWSAHVFLHWVGRDGPYADAAFDGQRPPETITF